MKIRKTKTSIETKEEIIKEILLCAKSFNPKNKDYTISVSNEWYDKLDDREDKKKIIILQIDGYSLEICRLPLYTIGIK